jgi:hypothetical protein
MLQQSRRCETRLTRTVDARCFLVPPQQSRRCETRPTPPPPATRSRRHKTPRAAAPPTSHLLARISHLCSFSFLPSFLHTTNRRPRAPSSHGQLPEHGRQAGSPRHASAGRGGEPIGDEKNKPAAAGGGGDGGRSSGGGPQGEGRADARRARVARGAAQGRRAAPRGRDPPHAGRQPRQGSRRRRLAAVPREHPRVPGDPELMSC